MDSPKKVSPERKFLHDMATPLAVIRLTLDRVIQMAKGDSKSIQEGDVLLRLEKVMASLKSIEDLHAFRRAEIYVEETDFKLVPRIGADGGK